MIGAPAAADAVDRARRLHSLKVGLHIVLTDGYPVSPPSRLPNLVDRSGRFRSDMARSSVRIFVDPTVRRQVADEIAAQFEAFLATGLRLDHVDCHKHWHLHPTISGLILDIGQRYGMTRAADTQRTGPRAETHREADVIEAFLGDFNLRRASQGPRPRAPPARRRQGIRIGVVGRDDRNAAGRTFGAFARRAHGNLLSSGNIKFVFRSRAGLSL